MFTESPEIRQLADGTISLYRNVKLMNGSQEMGLADRMVVEHRTGNQETVLIIPNNAGQVSVKRAIPQIQLRTSAVGTTSSGGFSLEDVDGNAEKRLLKLYRLFKVVKAAKAEWIVPAHEPRSVIVSRLNDGWKCEHALPQSITEKEQIVLCDSCHADWKAGMELVPEGE